MAQYPRHNIDGGLLVVAAGTAATATTATVAMEAATTPGPVAMVTAGGWSYANVPAVATVLNIADGGHRSA
jgi:hypothetical protein